MTLRHAAALALVGWYLMSPPFDASLKKPDLDAPLAKWSQIGSFDTAQECNGQEAYNLKQAHAARVTGLLLETDEAAQCIASDDPRLKGK